VLSAARTSSHEHADCGESHYLIGDILHRSGKFAEALDEFENALRIRKNVYGEMTLKVADVYKFKAIVRPRFPVAEELRRE
jgi:ribosomal protein S6